MHLQRLVVLFSFLASYANAQTTYAFATLAGRVGTIGSVDGDGAAARFNRPWGVTTDAAGNIYVTEATNHTVRKITRTGNNVTVSTLAGQAGLSGYVDGAGSAARFGGASSFQGAISGPFGIAAVLNSAVLVADGSGHALRRITTDGVVSTFSGNPSGNVAGSLDGAVSAALYACPMAVAVDASSNYYVADTYNHVIRKISNSGTVTTIAGQAGSVGFNDGVGSAARFVFPAAIALSPSGSLYVADGASTIRKLSLVPGTGVTWQVTTVAGSPLAYGATDGTGPAARFGAAPNTFGTGGYGYIAVFSAPLNAPFQDLSSLFPNSNFGTIKVGYLVGLAVDANENVFVTDVSNNNIRRISPSGVVTTIGGAVASGSTDGVATAARFSVPCGIAVDAAGTLYIADGFNHTIRVGAPAIPPRVQSQSTSQTVASGSNLTLFATPSSPLPVTFQWSRNGTPIAGATSSTLVLSNAQVDQSGTYTATLTNVAGTNATAAIVVTVSLAPVITAQPVAQNVDGGGTISLSVTASGSPAPAYQWLRNGIPIAGANAAKLTIANAQTEQAGNYQVLVANANGSTLSDIATVAVNTGRLVNLSIRSAVQNSEPLIAGFVIAGGAKQLLVRAIGPSLGQFGVAGAMTDPQLNLIVAGDVVASNDNWSSSAIANQVAAVAVAVGGFPLTANSLDSATLVTLSDSAVTGLASSHDGRGGIVLVEIYDAGPITTSRLVNVSVRAKVGAGENALFAGFAVGGNSPRTLVVRAVGPTLGAFGVTDTLADPILEVFTAGNSTARAVNDNWNGDAALAAAFTRVGAFPFPSATSKDAALIVTFEPGVYSARISGANGTTGEVLLEIYDLP